MKKLPCLVPRPYVPWKFRRTTGFLSWWQCATAVPQPAGAKTTPDIGNVRRSISTFCVTMTLEPNASSTASVMAMSLRAAFGLPCGNSVASCQCQRQWQCLDDILYDALEDHSSVKASVFVTQGSIIPRLTRCTMPGSHQASIRTCRTWDCLATTNLPRLAALPEYESGNKAGLEKT